MNYIDFDLTIIGCLLLASKYTENDDAYELDISGIRSYDLSIAYDRRCLKEYEIKCLKKLEYNLSNSTINDVLIAQIAYGVLYIDEIFDSSQINAFTSFTQNHLKQLTSSNMSILYDAEVLTLGIILYGLNYLNLSSGRMPNIIDKLKFNERKQFNFCYKEMKEKEI